MKKIWVLTSTAALLFAKSSHATVVSFQDAIEGYLGTEDTILIEGAELKNYGTTTRISAMNDRSGILRFDISFLDDELAPGDHIQVNSAYITVTCTYANNEKTVSMHQIYDANANWIEGARSSQPAEDGEPCWAYLANNSVASNRIDWAGSPGMQSAGVDYNPVAEDSVQAAALGDYQFDLTPALVEQWITGVNAGVVFLNPSTNIFVFGASEMPSPFEDRPKLTIDYEIVSAPPPLAPVVSIESVGAGQDVISWTTQQGFGYTYDVYYSTDLILGFLPAVTNLPDTVQIWTNAIDASPVFYQVRAQ